VKSTDTYILDTNVILHDPYCYKQYPNVIIPISVLEELDEFKKGHEPINYNAREFLHFVDEQRIQVHIEGEFHPTIESIFPDKTKVDNRILNLAYTIGGVLVTQDVNLRIKARSVGVRAINYTEGKVEPPPSHEPLKVTQKQLSEFFDKGLPYRGLHENQYVILKAGKSSGLGIHREGVILPIYKDKFSACKITAKNAEQTFALHALLDPTIPIVVISGLSGSGKTLLALAAAIEQRSKFRQLMVARPIIPLSNRDMGFLPGDIKEKMDPYMQPIFDNLSVIKGQYKEADKTFAMLGELVDKKKLVITPLAYIRGRSLNDIYFILDEAQNTSPLEIKTVGTRMGMGSKLVITGDVNQIDLPNLDSRSNGLSYMVEKLKGERLFAHVSLEKGERSDVSELISTKL